MSDQKPSAARAPRAFNLNSVEEQANETKASVEPKRKSNSKPGTEAKTKARRPRALKDKTILKTVPDEAAQRVELPAGTEVELADSLTPPPPGLATRKRFGWSRLFWGALVGLISLGIGLWVDQLIRDLFSRTDWLGWLALGLTGLLVLAAFAIILREFWGLARMSRIDKLRDDAALAVAGDDMKRAKGVIDGLERLYSDRPDTARGRTTLEQHRGQIIDGRDLIALAERDLVRPLDDKARALVTGSAKRVSVVTAVSPRALVDIGFVLVENMRLIRRIADLYGGRPGTFGFWRLTRNVIGHLAVTGSIAVGEGVVQQLVGHGLAARISTRLGEGVINGLLTARIGIAAIDVCRPLPFSDQTRPTIKDFMGELVTFSDKEKD